MKTNKPIRVAIACDQPIYRRGLADILMSPDTLQLVGEADNISETLQLVELVQPDVLLVDLKVPGEVYEQMTADLHDRWPDMAVILFVGVMDEGSVQCEHGPGLAYCVSKDISESEFLNALLQIGCGTFNEPAGRTDIPLSVSPESQSVADAQAELPLAMQHMGVPPGAVHAVPGIPAPMNFNQIQERLEHGESMTREMVMAGKIQADILPERTPVIRGWSIAAHLASARETSGDFYDFIPLANNNWGIVIADVTDKGMGAALFMALSSTLIRTYAGRYPSLPALTMDAVNERILSDTRGNMFVTAFFCVLEPHIGRLRYVNAGHPPAVVVSAQRGKPVDFLRSTGMALGVSGDVRWQQKIAKLTPGDMLLMYTDGVTEAQSPRGSFYGEQRMVDLIRRQRTRPAQEIQKALLDDVHNFVGESGAQDDIALIVIKPEEIA